MPFHELVEGKREGFRIKKRYIRKAGNICWAWLATSALRDDEGRFRYGVLDGRRYYATGAGGEFSA